MRRTTIILSRAGLCIAVAILAAACLGLWAGTALTRLREQADSAREYRSIYREAQIVAGNEHQHAVYRRVRRFMRRGPLEEWQGYLILLQGVWSPEENREWLAAGLRSPDAELRRRCLLYLDQIRPQIQNFRDELRACAAFADADVRAAARQRLMAIEGGENSPGLPSALSDAR